MKIIGVILSFVIRLEAGESVILLHEGEGDWSITPLEGPVGLIFYL